MKPNLGRLCLGVATLMLASACSEGSGSQSLLPSQLWLALDGDEQHVKLVSSMPNPY